MACRGSLGQALSEKGRAPFSVLRRFAANGGDRDVACFACEATASASSSVAAAASVVAVAPASCSWARPGIPVGAAASVLRRCSFSVRSASTSRRRQVMARSRASTCSVGLFWIVRARVAYCSVLSVSSAATDDGEQHAIISVRLLPPRLSMSSFVRLLSRYGTKVVELCCLLELSAEMTLPRQNKLLLIAPVSSA